MCTSNISVNINCCIFIIRQQKRSPAARRRATRVSTWMVPIIQPINHLLCFIPVGGITDGEVNQREMTPDSDSISVSIVQYSISRNLPQSYLPFVPYFITNIAMYYQTQGMVTVALKES